MTNTILDAGTYVCVAKFNNRGLELIDLDVLEPPEVCSTKDHNAHGAGAGVGASSNPLGIRSAEAALETRPSPSRKSGSRADTADPERTQSPSGSSRLSIASDSVDQQSRQ